MISPPKPKEPHLPLTSFAWTDVGRKRTHNEDFFGVIEDEEIFVLADGMGGHSSGEVASRLAVQHVIDYLQSICRQPEFSFDREVPPMNDLPARRLYGAIHHANERVGIESMKERRYEGMWTTIVVGMGFKDRILFAHVGDSRVYRLRDGHIKQLSEDHSYLNHLVRAGRMTAEEARNDPRSNVIMRAIGLKDHVVPDIQSHKRKAGDLYLFCSDGLSDLVEDWIIGDILSSEGHDLYATARNLVKIANDYGGKDNITVLLIRVGGVAAPGGEGIDSGLFDVDTDKIAIADIDDAELRRLRVMSGAARGGTQPIDEPKADDAETARLKRAAGSARGGTLPMGAAIPTREDLARAKRRKKAPPDA